jgi:hypothetical protein
MRGLCLSRSKEPPKDNSGRKRELNILLLIQGARLQKLEKVSRFESFNISVPLNDVHFSSPHWLLAGISAPGSGQLAMLAGDTNSDIDFLVYILD